MAKAFGIVNFAGNHVRVDGLQDHRPVAAFSFLGRYRIVDFPISNMSNSGIDHIQVYARRKPRSLNDHVGTGRHYNINSKSGRLRMLFSMAGDTHNLYNNDIASFYDNLECIEVETAPYVVIAPSYMIYCQNYNELIESHIASDADITMLYHTVDNAKEAFLNCNVLNLNKQKGVLSMEPNHGTAKTRNISMDTYVMKKELFINLIHKAKKISSLYTLADVINHECGELDIRGVSHRGYFAAISDFKSYFNANMSLIDIKTARSLFNPDWPIYTRTNDSAPTHYYDSAKVHNCVISNGCTIEGTVEHSILGRGVTIKEGAVVKNCVVLSGSVIGKDIHVENMVVDRNAKLIHVSEICAEERDPKYIERGDTL